MMGFTRPNKTVSYGEMKKKTREELIEKIKAVNATEVAIERKYPGYLKHTALMDILNFTLLLGEQSDNQ